MNETRQSLLHALCQADGQFVSGERLAHTLGISRAAVHKAAQGLSAHGYQIEAFPRKGYRLTCRDLFLPEEVGEYPAPVFLYDTLSGTNQTAKQLALQGAVHGTLVLTEHQTAGRGRLGRTFESPAGRGVYMTVLLRPSLSAEQAQRVTAAAAVAVCRAVQSLCGLSLSIKWVNDLYLGTKKVCGILTEAGTDFETGQLHWLAVGIGLNLTTAPHEFSAKVGQTATSLYPNGTSPVSRAALAGEIARQLLSLCPRFDCLDEYRSRCFLIGHWVTVRTAAEQYAAFALGIDDRGQLLIRRNGRTQALRWGEVSIRPTGTE